jgi:hypothetical protein
MIAFRGLPAALQEMIEKNDQTIDLREVLLESEPIKTLDLLNSFISKHHIYEEFLGYQLDRLQTNLNGKPLYSGKRWKIMVGAEVAAVFPSRPQ